MHRTLVAKGLAPLLMLLFLLPSQAQAASMPAWMAPGTQAQYLVIDNNVPNTPVVTYANWTIQEIRSGNITIQEDGLLGLIGAYGVTLLSSGTISVLGMHVVLSTVYNQTSRLCLRPCELFSPREHAWEWIPSNQSSSLIGQNFNILSTTFEVIGNSTLSIYNRTAWQLKPLVDVYSPTVQLYNFWYDQKTGILLQADLFVGGTGNLTVQLENSSPPSVGLQNLAIPLTLTQFSFILISTLAAYALIASRVRIRLGKTRLTHS